MTTLYVNGDSHTAAAEAVNPHAFAEDESQYFYMGRVPHPDNLKVSWGRKLSLALNTGFFCDAESASSNTRIMRTTRKWLSEQKSFNDVLVIIQWSTWERKEWLVDGIYYQVNASGIDHVPQSHEQQYKEFIANINWAAETTQAHNDIWAFHQELEQQNIKHIFFNGNTSFSSVPADQQKDWGVSYIGPYDPSLTFDAYLKLNGHETVSPQSWHFGKEAHSFFHKFMLQYIIANKFI